MKSVDIASEFPTAYKALNSLSVHVGRALSVAGLDPVLPELVRIRVSQINGCAFCLRMHTRDAIEKGESTDRLSVIAAWWESDYFTPAERAALTIAEQVTGIADAHRAAIAKTSEDALTDQQVAAVTWLAIEMNAWNRLAITSHYPVVPE